MDDLIEEWNDPDFPQPHLDPEDDPNLKDLLNKIDQGWIGVTVPRVERITDPDADESTLPEWVLLQRYGDYHYEEWDMEPRES